MEFNDVIEQVCSDLPEGFEIIIECENGCGIVTLIKPNGEREDFCDADSGIEIWVWDAMMAAHEIDEGQSK